MFFFKYSKSFFFFFKKYSKLTLKVNNILPIVFSQQLLAETTLIINKKNISLILSCLKLHINFQYKILSCISGIDLLNSFFGNSYRFSVIYDLLSLKYNTRLRVKLFLNEISLLFSVTNVFKNANWWEREIWDMFGIWFEKHPDLRRILTDYGFDGFPLRKDFPLIGYIEIFYDYKKKRIIAKPCELTQDFRIFIFENSWI